MINSEPWQKMSSVYKMHDQDTSVQLVVFSYTYLFNEV
jgi:hypothetical protein